MSDTLLSFLPGHGHLRRLVALRNMAVFAQVLTLAAVWKVLGLQLDWPPMLLTVALLATANLLTWLRLRSDQPVTNAELFAQLCLDVAALSILLYYGGGSTNPFVSLYLLPLVIAAATLPGRYTWGMAALTLACYSLLMVQYVPLPDGGNAHAQHDTADMTRMDHAHHQMDAAPGALPAAPDAPLEDAFNIHVIGMWLGFVISALVVAYFVAEMARAVRLRDAQLNRAREDILRNERIVAVGTQAAGAAHELGTPLATMSVVIGEMRNECAAPEQKNDLDILDEQVKNCKRILDGLLSHAQETPEELPADEFIRKVLDEWQLLRPTVQYRFRAEELRPAPRLRTDPSLRPALLNLLNNAADASPEAMDILLRRDGGNIVLEIRDHGPGLTPEAAARAGSAFFTTKQEGHGLGLFLANATIERMGGTVRLLNRKDGGATTELTLPAMEAPA